MGATILKNPPIGYENHFAGNYLDSDIPEDRIRVSDDHKLTEIIAVWNGTVWIEGANSTQIASINTPVYEEKIIEHFTYLMNRALSSSMGKYGSYEYLQIQKREYDNKYLVAKGLTVNTPVASAIQKEMERDFPISTLDAIITSYGVTDLSGTQLEKMYTLIIIRYEYAKNRLDNFEGMAIDFRTKCRTLVENSEWTKLDTAFNLVKNFPENPSNTDIENYYNQFDAL